MKSAVRSVWAPITLGPITAAMMLVPVAHARPHPVAPAQPVSGPAADYPVTIGDPYVIGGVTYTPSDTLNYDAVGYARMGSETGVSGAHHSLPLPCYVEVTALDTGHTVLVRLTQRGPMTGKQLIELSPQAWAQLGFATDTTSGADVTASGAGRAVRVRRVNPPEAERARLRSGGRAPERMDTPPGLLTALRRKLDVAKPSTPDEPPSATLSATPGQKPGLPLPAAMPTANATSKSAPRPIVPSPVPAKVVPAKEVPAKVGPAPAAVMPVVHAAEKRPIATAKPEPKAPEPKLAPLKPPAPKPIPAKPAIAKTVVKPAETTPSGHYAVQVAAFASHANADKAAAQVGGKVEPAGKLWRVRIVAGNDEQARAALAKAKQAGYAGAMILHHD